MGQNQSGSLDITMEGGGGLYRPRQSQAGYITGHSAATEGHGIERNTELELAARSAEIGDSGYEGDRTGDERPRKQHDDGHDSNGDHKLKVKFGHW